jgi:hypothetical protein
MTSGSRRTPIRFGIWSVLVDLETTRRRLDRFTPLPTESCPSCEATGIYSPRKSASSRAHTRIGFPSSVRLETTSECPSCIPSFPQLSDSRSCSVSSTTIHPSEMIFCRTKSGAHRQPHTKPAGIDRDCRYSTRSALPEGWRSGGCAKGSSARRSSPPSRSRSGLRFYAKPVTLHAMWRNSATVIGSEEREVRAR